MARGITSCYGFVFNISPRTKNRKKKPAITNWFKHLKYVCICDQNLNLNCLMYSQIVSNPTFLRPNKIASLKFLFPIFHYSWLDVGCLDDTLLVPILDNLQQILEGLEHRRKQLKNYYALLSVGWASTTISFIPEASHSCKFLTHFKWLNAREEVLMSILKEGFS